ncbi:MAG: hypothetical protein GY865_17455 [candidate division Zixibacteria bacterium]|nr:hypothetical protein [candidate division Zixibacteria bacterium]
MPDLYLVGFKGNRKEYFFNKFHHSLKLYDSVIVQVERGEDVGLLLQKASSGVSIPSKTRPGSILRPANDEDLRKRDENRIDEESAWKRALELITKHQLEMKLIDIEYQFDRNKITFFFTAEHRVDFRALVRDLASEYKTRIELRQIGVRDEAKRIGGFGVCGLQQCCAAFLTNFEPISTQDAREQGLSLNPSKISGNCGRLLCCLKYELDYYTTVRKKYPEIGQRFSKDGFDGIVDKISILDDYMIIRNVQGEELKVLGKDIINANKSNSNRSDSRNNHDKKNNRDSRDNQNGGKKF